MRWNELSGDDCPIARAQSVIGDRWSALIVRDALRGVTRFEGFHGRLGCSRAMVAKRLEHLVACGVLEQRPYQPAPVRYDYVPTEAGRALGNVLMMMSQWAESWRPKAGAQPLRRYHKACGHSFQPLLVCSECLEPVQPGGVEYGDQGRVEAS